MWNLEKAHNWLSSLREGTREKEQGKLKENISLVHVATTKNIYKQGNQMVC
jgi:hypothetical protein